jgi:hypothetical protein
MPLASAALMLSAHRNRRLARASARETLNQARAARAVSGAATDAFMPLLSPKSKKSGRGARVVDVRPTRGAYGRDVATIARRDELGGR